MNRLALARLLAPVRRLSKSTAPIRNARKLAVERLEARENPAPIPSVLGLGSSTLLLGEQANFGFSFENTGDKAGFAPFIEVALDTSGPDGATSAPLDGYGTPTVTGAGLTLTAAATITLTAGQTTFTNPLTGETNRPVPAGFGKNDTIYVYALPFGSFNPTQKTAVTVAAPTSNLADVGTKLPIAVTGGFRDDEAALDGPGIYDGPAVAGVTPELYRFRKVYLGPEDETATGPNFIRRYRLEVDVADGQTLNNFKINDDLAPSMQIVSKTTTNIAAFTSAAPATNVFVPGNLTGSAVTTAPDGTLTYTFGNVLGTTKAVDAAFEFDFYVPRDLAGGGQVVPQNATTGTDSTTNQNTGSTAATWTPLDGRDPANQNVAKAAPDNGPHTLEQQSIAIQKQVDAIDPATGNVIPSTGIRPGITLLRYTLNFQVSDYYAFDDVFVRDQLSDGQRLFVGTRGAVNAFPTMTVNNAYLFDTPTGSRTTTGGLFAGGQVIEYQRRHTSGNADSDPTSFPANGPALGAILPGVFLNQAAAPDTNVNTGGTSLLQFNVSEELIARLGATAGRLVGGEIGNDGSGPTNNPIAAKQFAGTTGTIVFYAEVVREFSDAFPSGDESVDQGDVLTNSVDDPTTGARDGIFGTQLRPSTINAATPTAIGTGSDDSGASVVIPYGQQEKQIYAINGQTVPPAGPTDPPLSLQPGDRVTYRLTYTLPISSFENLRLIDFPPLPVMDVDDSGPFTFVRTPAAYGFLPGQVGVLDVVGTNATDDTYFATFDPALAGLRDPSVTSDSATNSVTLDFGSREDFQRRATQISVLVTFVIGDQPFSQDLFLTNQLRVAEGSTNAGDTTVEDLRRFELVRPFVTVQKGTAAGAGTGFTVGTGADQIIFGNTTVALPAMGTSVASGVIRANGAALSPTNAVFNATQSTNVGGQNITLSNAQVDAGDTVRYAVVVQNTGKGDAFDIQLTDTIQPQYDRAAFTPATDLRVIRGDGTVLTAGTDYTITYNSSTGQFSIAFTDNYSAGNVGGAAEDNRLGGLSRGNRTAGAIDNGSNTIIVLYDVTFLPAADPNAPRPNQLITNTATVPVYSNTEGGDDLTDPAVVPGATEPTDQATVRVKLPLVQKTLVDTEIGSLTTPTGDNLSTTTEPGNSDTQAVIGEYVWYDLTLTVPEGFTPGGQIIDTLNNGLAFVDVVSVTSSGGLSFANGGLPVAGTLTNAAVSNGGRTITFNLGDISNGDNDNATAETIRIRIRAVVLNTNGAGGTANNQATQTRNNTARFEWTSNTTTLTTVSAGQSNTLTGGVTGTATPITIVEPTVTTVKDVANFSQGQTFPGAPGTPQTTRGDAGDEIDYRITLTHSGTTAFDVALSDPLPLSFFTGGFAIQSVVSTGTIRFNGAARGATLADFAIDGAGNLTFVAGLDVDMVNGATITIIVRGTDFTGSTGQLVPNVAAATWSSLDGDESTPRSAYNASSVERTGVAPNVLNDGSLNDYRTADNAVIESPPVIRKTIIATSEAHTGPTITPPGLTTGVNTAVGEIVRFRVYLSIGETPTGTPTLNVQLRDFLPAGMSFLNDGTARYAFISSNGANLTSSTLANVGITGDQATLAGLLSSAIAGTFLDGDVSTSLNVETGEAYGDGQDVFFRFGDLSNADRDTNVEYVVVEYNALVLNVAGNQSGTNLDNYVTAAVGGGYIDVVNDANGDGLGTGENTIVVNVSDPTNLPRATATVVEPVVIDVDKTANPTSGVDAGDTVTYTVTFSNTGNADAFNLALVDLLGPGLALTPGTVTVAGGTGGVVTTGNAGGDTSIRVDLASLAVGGAVTITYQATLTQAVTPNQTVNNTATLTYTSLPGGTGTAVNPTGSATPGGSGTATGERDGTGGVNDYADNDAAAVTTAVASFQKFLATTAFADASTSGANVAVGETVTYALRVNLPEGTAPGLTVTDVLPLGLRYVSAAVVTTAAGSFGLLTADFNGTVPAPTVAGGAADGDDVTFTFGSITTTGDNGTGNNSFLILLTAVVTNRVPNEGILPGQTTLDNQGTFNIPGDGIGAFTTPNVTVTVVEPRLQIVKSVVGGDTTRDAGDPITFELVVGHTAASSGPAFDLLIADAIPAGMSMVNGSAVVQSAPGYSAAAVGANGPSLSVTAGELRVGDTIVIQYQAFVTGAVPPGGTVTNTATTNYDTAPGPNPDQRIEPTVGDPETITVHANTIAGEIYYDADNNGVRGGSEALITGQAVQVRLTGTDHLTNPVDVTVTTTTGLYSFTGLRPGTYVVTQLNQPTGFLDGRDTPGTSSPGAPFGGTGTAAAADRGTPTAPARDADAITTITIGLEGNKDGINYNFGELLPARVGNFVWEDRDGNGRQDAGEPGINGVTVTLTGTDDTGRAVTAVTTTVNDGGGNPGFYQFTNVRPGTYAVTFGTTDGTTTFARTVRDSAVATDASDSDGDPATGTTKNYVVVAGTNDQTIDQGLYVPINVGDTVWFDQDNDGKFDAGTEPGIPDVAVNVMWYGPDEILGTGDDLSFDTTTGPDGTYLVPNLPPGKYAVAVDPASLPEGLVQTFDLDGTATAHTAKLTAVSGADRLDADFGYRGTGSVGDTIFLDVNNNGQYDAGEGLAGVQVTVSGDVNGDGLPDLFTTTTDTDGKYTFPNLRVTAAGLEYAVTPNPATLPSGVVQTVDPDGPPNGDSGVTISTGTPDDILQDFGYRGPGSIGDTVFLDLNNNGLPDTGEGIFSITVELTGDFDGDRKDETVSATTDADGRYLFSGLVTNDGTGAGVEYTVTVVAATLPSSVTQTVDPLGALDNASKVTLTDAAATDLLQDFGYRGTGAVGDTVWYDADSDGLKSGNEPGVVGARVTVVWFGPDGIEGNDDDVTTSTLTGPDGFWQVTGLPPGDFRASVDPTTLPAGLTVRTFDADGKATADTSLFDLTNGQARDDQDFGYRGTAKLGDFVWVDLNGDGKQDANEPGVPNAKLTLTWYGQDGQLGGGDDAVLTPTTDAAGKYQFTDLPGGKFQVDVDTTTIPANLLPTFDLDGTATKNVAVVTLAAGGNEQTVDFGYKGTASVGDFVWYDVNNDGTPTFAEPGIAGVTVTLLFGGADGDLTTALDNITFVTTTDANGKYLFDGLPVSLKGGRPNFLPNYAATVSTVPAIFDTQTFDLDGLNTPNAATFVLDLSENRRDVDFGFRGTAELGDFVFEDVNGNGVQDAGDPGIAGVAVNLLDAAGNKLAATATDAAGKYSFPGLAAGSYKVAFVAVAKYAVTAKDQQLDDAADSDADATGVTAVVALATGEVNPALDAGLYVPVSIGDTVYFDTDGDGKQALANEPGIPGATVTLTYAGPDGVFDNADDKTFTTTTDANGKYLFPTLPPGNFKVDVSNLPSGAIVPTADLDGVGTPNTTKLTAVSGTDRLDADFGYRGPGGLGDTVYFDFNGDGVQTAGEPGIANAMLTLTWLGFDGKAGGGDDVTYTTTTDAAGKYAFGNLPFGTFVTSVDPTTLPVGFNPVTDLDGVGTPHVATATLTAAAPDRTDVDFGYRGTGSLGDRVWQDFNRDGKQDADEPGVPNAKVTINFAGVDGVFGTADDGLFTTITGANGLYGFANLPPGTYKVSVDPATLPTSTLPTYDLDGTADNTTTTGLTLGQNRTDVDFGVRGLASVSGSVFRDDSNDGRRDPGEPGYAGVTVTLTGTDILGNAITRVTTTDMDGRYTFINLEPGTYTVTETTQPPETADGLDTAGTVNGVTRGTAGNDVISNITLGQGEPSINNDFGELAGSVAGTVFVDLDRDGKLDPGETPLPGETIQLIDSNGVVIRTTTTGPDGTYLIRGFPPATYTVRGVQPTGYGSSSPSDLLVNVPPLGLTGLDFAEVTGTVSGYVYRDLSVDGVRGNAAGETGIGGTPVTLTGTDVRGNQITRTLTTNTDGSYRFDGLLEAQYVVSETQPTGFYYDGLETPGSLGGTTPTNDVLTVGLPPGIIATDYNFGELPPADPFGFVYVDVNRNGVKDPGEPGIPGVQIRLSGTAFAGTILARPVTAADVPGGLTVTTNAVGRWEYPLMPPGLYSILEVAQPAGFLDGREHNADPNGPTPIVGNDRFDNIVLNPNPIRGPFNFGEFIADPTKQQFLSSTQGVGTPSGNRANVPMSPAFTVTTGTPTQPAFVVTAAGAGSSPLVRVFDYATGGERLRFMAYETAFTGGVRVATGDVNGDGTPDIVTGIGVGGGPRIREFSGVDGAEIYNNFVYEQTFRGGLFVALGDVNGDGRADLVTGTDKGGGPRVRVIDLMTGATISDFFAFDSNQRGGVRVAVADFDGDGKADILATAGAGVQTSLRVFGGGNPNAVIRELTPYTPTFTGGVFVAAGDVTGDGMPDIVSAADAGGGPHVQVFDGKTGALVHSFFAYESRFTGGVRVAAQDVNGDGRADIVTAPGRTGGPRVRIFSGADLTPLDDFYAVDPEFIGGVFVG